MKRNVILSLAFLLAALCSCDKLPQSGFLGEWTVTQACAHDITSTRDNIVSNQAASPCFVVGEKMEFTKTTIVPCPSSIVNLKQYDEFKGTFDYTFDRASSSITIHEVSCISVFTDPATDYQSISSITVYEMTYKVNQTDDNTLLLSGERYEYDKLGNATRCYRAEVTLKR